MSKEIWVWPSSEIVRIIDGDTFVAKVHRDMDFGFHVLIHSEAQIKMRLNRINAPDIKTTDGKVAASKLAALMPVGTFVNIETVGPYKYGDEWMAEVTVGTLNASDAMVAAGCAAFWDGTGPRPLGSHQ